nr:MAG TPA: hypothetical protein [Caudoviricetes sp.]
MRHLFNNPTNNKLTKKRVGVPALLSYYERNQ